MRGKVARIAMKGFSMQVLRDTFGSHLLRRKVSVYLVSKYLGHSSVDVTTRHYAHVPIEDTHDEIDLL
jgi:integrase